MNRAIRFANAISRAVLVHPLGRPVGHLVVNEFPKSGGTWVAQMLAGALEMPFPRNRLPSVRAGIIHGHYLYGADPKRSVVVFRDGRDVMVSWYFHCLFVNERNNADLVDIVRGDLSFSDFTNVRDNLPAFIEYTFTKSRHPRFSWTDFVHRWLRSRPAAVVRYEDMRASPTVELVRIVRALKGYELPSERSEAIAYEFSFDRMSGRRAGEEKRGSFMRKGVVGDWRNHFSGNASRVFRKHAGDALLALGYEKNHLWAEFD